MSIALIIGSQGQDGKLLTELLVQKGYRVIGIDRNPTEAVTEGNSGQKNELSIEIECYDEVRDIISELIPQEVYYLAAYHHSSEDDADDERALFARSQAINVQALQNVLEAIRTTSPETRLFYAASSHIFGNVLAGVTQDECTTVEPSCVYGITKAAGMFTCRYYRNKYNLFASVGILYNHESKYRREGFLSRRIIEGIGRILRGEIDQLVLGNLSSRADWGYAPDYVRAMHVIMQLDAPDDFVVASGESHTVQEFVDIAFTLAGLDWRKYVVEDRSLVKKVDILRVGSPAKLVRISGWTPTVTFQAMVRSLLREEGILA